MNYCASCGERVPDDIDSEPRLPCPLCGAMSRILSADQQESCNATASSAASQIRPGQNGSATLDEINHIQLSLSGRPPRNEEGSLVVSARLVRTLNTAGQNWTEPAEPDSSHTDFDAVSTDRGNSTIKLNMQVVRAASDQSLWQTLSQGGIAQKNYDITATANELISAVRKKAEKYPRAQRNNLTLLLDATHTPNHTFQQVHDLFAHLHRDECLGYGFASVWVIGADDQLVTRLDQ